MKNTRAERTFKYLCIASIVAVYLVILAGGIVRSTGSGMGCPDWPRCFGNWIPPTLESQLPSDYKEQFKIRRHKKNEILARYLQELNFDELAYQVLHEQTDALNLQFNVQKTYIEYINRVLGVITGILFFITFLQSLTYLRKNRQIIFLAFFNLILVGFQGWIGSLVVSTDLLPWVVTIHMLITFLILALLIYLIVKISDLSSISSGIYGRSLQVLILISIVASLIQVCFGTQVREGIDVVAKSFLHINREKWIDGLGLQFYLHRSFSWIILLLNLGLIFYAVKKVHIVGNLLTLFKLVLLIVFLEIVTGVFMSYFSIPAILQPIHLFLATILFSLQFLLLLIINFRNSQHKFTS